jgi:hypothetical protein
MVRQPEQTPVSPAAGPGPVPVFVTVRERSPDAAVAETVIVTGSSWSETRVTDVTVTPVPEMPTVGEGANPSPAMVIAVDAPRGTEAG